MENEFNTDISQSMNWCVPMENEFNTDISQSMNWCVPMENEFNTDISQSMNWCVSMENEFNTDISQSMNLVEPGSLPGPFIHHIPLQQTSPVGLHPESSVTDPVTMKS
jgi:hypothetical protein